MWYSSWWSSPYTSVSRSLVAVLFYVHTHWHLCSAVWSASNHYLFQCYLIVNSTSGNPFECNSNRNSATVIQKKHFKLSSDKIAAICPGWDDLITCHCVLHGGPSTLTGIWKWKQMGQCVITNFESNVIISSFRVQHCDGWIWLILMEHTPEYRFEIMLFFFNWIANLAIWCWAYMLQRTVTTGFSCDILPTHADNSYSFDKWTVLVAASPYNTSFWNSRPSYRTIRLTKRPHHHTKKIK